jgi:O-antigen ligase
MKATALSSEQRVLNSQERTNMKSNVGGIDRVIRVALGAVLVALAATGTVGVWAWLGLLPLATGLLGWCPPYSLLGINTCKNKNT